MSHPITKRLTDASNRLRHRLSPTVRHLVRYVTEAVVARNLVMTWAAISLIVDALFKGVVIASAALTFFIGILIILALTVVLLMLVVDAWRWLQQEVFGR